MVSSKEENLVYGLKFSSVGPGRMTGQNVVHEPTSMDLAMKLHYFRGVYYFRSQAVQGLTIMNFKEPMFTWLSLFYITCGRFRRSDSGRPFIKCNDCGVRVIEAECVKTIDEWLEMSNDCSLQKLIVSNQVIGPEIPFSPLILIQLTWFKCGGMSVGLSWAHVLGDAFSASDIINMLGQIMAGHQPSGPTNLTISRIDNKEFASPPPRPMELHSVKRVDPVGDYWITANNCKMGSFSFHITSTQLTNLQSKISGRDQPDQIPSFESLCAIIWQSLAKVRNGPEPKIVTICKNDSCKRKNEILGNSQIISVVKAGFCIAQADPKELAALVVDQAIDEASRIEEAMEGDHGLSDFIMYGVNLTFVDLEEANLYGLELQGQKPIFVNCTIEGIGDEGVVLVLPWPKGSSEDGGDGRIVTVILPENQVLELKSELENEWSIA